jgi:hypothetical protein
MAGHSATITVGGDVIGSVATFDWAPSTTIADQGNQAFVDYINTAGRCENTPTGCVNDVYSHGQLAAFQDSNNTTLQSPGLGTAYEITFEIGFSEKVLSATSTPLGGGAAINTVVFGFGPNGKVVAGSFQEADAVLSDGSANFFRMYVDLSPDADQLAGTGFGADGVGGDTTLVLSGQVLPSSGFTSNFTANTSAPPPIGGESSTTPNPEWYIDGNPVTTVDGSGGTSSLDLLILASYVDEGFFGGTLTQFLLSSISQLTPFTTTDPSLTFPQGNITDAKADVAGNGDHINGGTTLGEDGLVATNPSIMFQTDPNSPLTVVPEPSILALLSLGLLGIGAARRRKA